MCQGTEVKYVQDCFVFLQEGIRCEVAGAEGRGQEAQQGSLTCLLSTHLETNQHNESF